MTRSIFSREERGVGVGERGGRKTMWDSMPSSSYLYTPEEGRTMAWKTEHGWPKGRSVRSMKRSIRNKCVKWYLEQRDSPSD